MLGCRSSGLSPMPSAGSVPISRWNGVSMNTSSEAKKAIERTFSPEFRNRMDGWIAFSSLPLAVVEKIVDKQIDELRAQLKEKNVELSLTEAARKWLADRGFSPQFGARPMNRLIQTAVKKPLAERILFGDLEKGGRVILDVIDGKLDLRLETAN